MAVDFFWVDSLYKPSGSDSWSKAETPVPVGLFPVRRIEHLMEAAAEAGDGPRLPDPEIFRQMQRKKFKNNEANFVVCNRPEWQWGARLVELTEHLMTPRASDGSALGHRPSDKALEHRISRVMKELGVEPGEAKLFGRVARREDDDFLPEERAGRWRARFIPLRLVPAFVWCVLRQTPGNQHLKRKRTVATDLTLNEFRSKFVFDFLANWLKRGYWGYGPDESTHARSFWLREFDDAAREELKSDLEVQIRGALARLDRMEQ